MEDSKPFLSIIVPLYNAELYIETCINSILSSNLDSKDYEVIIVNDGSTDKGPCIVQKYVEQYANMQLIHQENQGLSVARNTGINNCNGEYFWCVDADDYVDENLSVIIDCINENKDLDILAVKELNVEENNDVIGVHCYHPSVPYGKLISGAEAILAGYSPSSACALIVRKQFIDNCGVLFKPGITHQDVEWTYRLFPYAQQVYFSHITPYYYVNHADSISHSINPNKKLKYYLDDVVIIKSFESLASKYKKNYPELSNTIYQRSRNTQLGLVLSIYNNRKQLKNLGILSAIIVEFKKSNVVPLKGDFLSKKKNIVKKYLNIWLKIMLYKLNQSNYFIH